MSIGNVGAGDLGNVRRPTPAIWKDFEWALTNGRPGEGFVHHEDFAVGPAFADNTTGVWTGNLPWRYFTSDSSGVATFSTADSESAIVVTSDGDNEGFVLSMAAAPLRITSGSGRKVAFEARVKSSTITDTKHGFFLGLFEPLVPTASSHIQASGAMADENFIGFHRLEGDGDKLDVVWKADTVTQQTAIGADAITLVADTYVKVGFVFDGATTIRFYYNETDLGSSVRIGETQLEASAFPSDINLSMAFALINATATTPGSSTLDWMRCGMMYAED